MKLADKIVMRPVDALIPMRATRALILTLKLLKSPRVSPTAPGATRSARDRANCPLRLETGEAAGDGLEPLADGIEMVQSLLEMEIGEVVGGPARCAGRWR